MIDFHIKEYWILFKTNYDLMKNLYIVLLFVMPSYFVFGQTKSNIIVDELNAWSNTVDGIKDIAPCTIVAEDDNAKKDVLGATYFQLNSFESSKIWDVHNGAYRLKLPYEGKTINVLLYESTQNNVPVSTPTVSNIKVDQGKSFRGIIENDPTSVVGISFFRNGDIYGIISSKSIGNIVIAPLLNQPKNVEPTYIIYNDQKLKVGNPFTCASADQIPEEDGLIDLIGELRGQNVDINKCVRVGFLVSYPMYSTRFGSNSTTATNYVRALSNNMGAIYALHNVHQKIGDIYIFNTAASDTFNYSSTITALESFGWSLPANYMPNSDLFHLLHPGMGGGVAWLNVLCNPISTYNGSPYDYRVAVSGALSSTITNVPTFSWNVEVCTHELGHNLGSPHTHACNWNGANTKIDDCGTNAGYDEGSCPPAPGLPPTNTGTVMSYCHLVSTGINFAYGFGPQPGDLIDSKVNNASCLTSCCTAGITTNISPDTCVAAGTSITITASGAQVYSWRYDADTYSYGSTFTVVVNKDYIVTVTGYNNGDCQGEQIITIRMKPVIPTISNTNRTVCQNGSDIIIPTGPRICQLLPSVRITEIHYDNTGTDVNEFVEVGGPAGTNLSCYKIVFYNGSTPTAAVGYDSISLSGTIDNENGCGYGAVSFLRAGIQNGTNDGLALLYRQSAICPEQSDLIEFISYEGVTTGASGWAKSIVSKNLPVFEAGTEPVGQSLQLVNGTWVGPQTDSRDSLQTSTACFNFYATDPSLGGATPFYSGPSFTINATSSPINTATAGTFMVWVTNRSSSCSLPNTCESAPVKLTYTISPTTPTITATQYTICNSGSSTLTVNGGPFVNYTWSTGETTQSITVSPIITTTYTVTVSDGGSCSGTASVTINVGSNLTPTAIVNPNFICNPSGGSVTVSATAGYNSYTWSSGQLTQSFTTTVGSTTTFTVTVSDGVCTGTASATVTVGGSITPTIVSNPSGAICSGSSTTLSLTSAYSSYSWSTGQSTPTIIVSPTMSSTYTVTVQDIAGCTGTGSITINVNPLPVPVITGNLNICQGASTTLSTLSTYNSYSWSTGATTSSITVSPTTNTTYSVTVTDNNLCTGVTAATVTVTAPPTVVINAVPSSPVCAGTSCTFSTNPNTFTSYLWSNGAITPTITLTLNSSGTYSVTCTNASGCQSVASYQMVVNPKPAPPTILAEDNPINLCLFGIDTIKPIAAPSLPTVPNVILSEFHYDNIGTDANEFIEVAGPAGTNLACYTLQLYNGNTPTAAVVYDTKVLSGTIDNEGNGYGAVDFVYPVNGIQNGATDGIALVYVNSATCPNPTSVLQFISYEGGPITGSGGYANGLNSIAIPVQEDFPVPGVGYSLQYNFATSTWVGPNITTNQGSLPLVPAVFKFYNSNPVPGPATAFLMDTLMPIGPSTTPISSSIAGMYMVWVTNVANGCESSPVKTVININDKPILTAVPASQTICSNENCNIQINSTVPGTIINYFVIPTPNTVGATAGSGNTILQRLTNGTFAPISVTYRVYGVSPFGCKSDTISVVVTVNPNPTEDFPRHYCVCPGGSVKLIGPAGYTYLWLNGGHTLKDTTITTPGSYTLKITNQYGCSQNLTYIVDRTPDFTMVCNDLLDVSLDTNCMAIINWDMVLEGDPLCYDGLTVKIYHKDNITVNDTLTIADIGTTLTYEVYNCNYNKCWGKLKIEDKTAPKLNCRDTSFLCGSSQNPSFTGFPNGLKLGTNLTQVGNQNKYLATSGNPDKCSASTLTFIDKVTDYSCPNVLTRRIERIWSAIDIYGNTTNCTQVITYRRSTLADVVMPKDYDGKPGNNPIFDVCNSAYRDSVPLATTGKPTVGLCGSIQWTVKTYKIPDCGIGYTLLREWRLYDWCDQSVRIDTQFIRVRDITNPTFTCPTDITVTTDALNCLSSGYFPVPVITDRCSKVTYSVTYNSGTICGSTTALTMLPDGATITKFNDSIYRFEGFPTGNYNFKYRAVDECGNFTECSTFDIFVRDITAPVPVCRTLSQVSLGSGVCGSARVDAAKFDEGSWDNCGNVYFKAKRLDPKASSCENSTLLNDYVNFCCEDTVVNVLLRIYDSAPISGTVLDNYRPVNSCGSNYNDCVVKVVIEDRVSPIIQCPTNVEISCSAYDFSTPTLNADTAWFNKYFGKVARQDCSINQNRGLVKVNGIPSQIQEGWAYDNCTVYIPQTITSQIECGVGTITRTFRSVDKAGRQSTPCTQSIVITNQNPFFINAGHYTDPGADLADPCDGAERIRIGANEDFANDLYVSPNFAPDNIVWPDKIVELPNCTGISSIGTECANTGKDAGKPRILRNDKCDLVAMNYVDEVYPIATPACVKILRTWTVIDWCQNKPLGRKWTYTQVIKLVNNIAPDFTGNTCKNDTICQYPTDCGPDPVVLCATAKDDCTPDDQLKYSYFIDLNNDGTNDINGKSSCVTITRNNGLKYGRHMITWSVEDNCGNVKTCTKVFIIKDCKKPTPVAKLLALELMPNNCQATLEASKLNNFSWDNCTPMNNLRFRVAKLGEYSSNMTLDQVLALNDYVVFGAGEIGSQTIALFVIDNDNNWDFVETFVLVQTVMNPDCANNGNNNAIVSGTIQTELKENIDKVEIKVNGVSKYITDAQGTYSIALPKNNNYIIRPVKLNDARNGITTADLVAMNKHILGIELLNSPYKRIAADINNDKKISTADMVELRKLILFINDNFSNNSSWMMIDKNYNFKTSSPEKEIYTTDIIESPLTTSKVINFVGLKVGDVNNSAKPNGLVGVGEERNGFIYNFITENAIIKAGETKSIELKLEKSGELEGYQFTFNFDPKQIEIQNISGLSEDHFGLRFMEEGAITVSNDKDQMSNLTLQIKAKKNVSLENVLSIGSRYTAAEAYTSNGELANIGLKFSGTVENNFQLMQNMPNPFSQNTTIGFVMPEGGSATFTIFDAMGKVVYETTGNYNKGYNELILNKNKLFSSGIYTYRLTTDKHSATKQMILTE